MYEKHEMEVIIFDENCAFCSETTVSGNGTNGKSAVLSVSEETYGS